MTDAQSADNISRARVNNRPGPLNSTAGGKDAMEQSLNPISGLRISSEKYEGYTMNFERVSFISSRANEYSRLFALIIGIDTYTTEDFWNLRGAKADAERFKAYLTTSLSFSETHVELLLDDKAKRADIIGALERIANDDRIVANDPIVIFYAGHGAEKEDLLGGEKHKIQMLVPYDSAGIPDFIIGALLDHISAKKGDNITVIFDCCNSASGTRGIINDSDSAYRTRAINPDLVKYDSSLDHDLYARIGIDRNNTTREFRSAKVKSRILLAACQSFEEAKEFRGHGVFTSALLKLFEIKPPTILRYCDILMQMDMISGQNPQCEGYHQERKIFDGKVETRSRSRFEAQINRTSTNPQLTLRAGSAQGITKGATFNIYDIDDTSFVNILGEAIVEDSELVTAFETTATLRSSILKSSSPRFDTHQRYVAVLTRTGEKADLVLYIPPQDSFIKIYDRLCQNGEIARKGWTVNTAEDKRKAHLQASMSGNDSVGFELHDNTHKFSRRFEVWAGDDRRLAWVLSRMAHFYRELDRRNPVPELTNDVTVEFYKLVVPDRLGSNFTWRMLEREPSGENLCRENIIDFKVEHDAPYGFKLTNKGHRDLYPYVFYFDNSNLNIDPYFMVTTSESKYEVDAPLKAGGFLTLGHGSVGTHEPPVFFMDEDQNMDLGYLKVYLTTKPVDFDNVPQDSPFKNSTRAARAWVPPSVREDKWDALTIPMIQRRRTPVK